MGFLFGKKGPGHQDYVDVGVAAGFALGTAISRLGAGAPFDAVVHCGTDDDPRIYFLSHGELDAWTRRNAATYPRRAICVAIEHDGSPALAVTAWVPGVSVSARTAFRTAPFGFDRAMHFSIDDANFVDVVKEAFVLGLSSNEAAAPFLEDDEDPEVAAAHERLIETAERELAQKAALLPHGTWAFSQDTGRFTVSSPSGAVLAEGRFQVIASYSSNTGTLFWAWANDSVDAALKAEVEKVRAWGLEQRLYPFGEPRIPCPEGDARRLIAVAVHRMNAPAWKVQELTPTAVIYSALYDLDVKAPN